MEITKHAEAIAAKVDSTAVGLDPLLIITIITQILPGLLNCFRENDDVDSSSMKSRVQQLHERDPAHLRKRLAKNIRRRSRDEKLTQAQAHEMADATIAHVLESPASAIVDCCRECGQLEQETSEDGI